MSVLGRTLPSVFSGSCLESSSGLALALYSNTETTVTPVSRFHACPQSTGSFRMCPQVSLRKKVTLKKISPYNL